MAGEPLRDRSGVPKRVGGRGRIAEHLALHRGIVDELADMMMTVGKKVEALIARLPRRRGPREPPGVDVLDAEHDL